MNSTNFSAISNGSTTKPLVVSLLVGLALDDYQDIFLIVSCVLSLLSNILVVAIMRSNSKTQKTTNFRRNAIHLSVAKSCHALFMVIMGIYRRLSLSFKAVDRINKPGLCTFVETVSCFLSVSGPAQSLCLSLDRLLTTLLPIQYGYLIQDRKFGYINWSMWFLSLIFSLISLSLSLQAPSYTCTIIYNLAMAYYKSYTIQLITILCMSETACYLIILIAKLFIKLLRKSHTVLVDSITDLVLFRAVGCITLCQFTFCVVPLVSLQVLTSHTPNLNTLEAISFIGDMMTVFIYLGTVSQARTDFFKLMECGKKIAPSMRTLPTSQPSGKSSSQGQSRLKHGS